MAKKKKKAAKKKSPTRATRKATKKTARKKTTKKVTRKKTGKTARTTARKKAAKKTARKSKATKTKRSAAKKAKGKKTTARRGKATGGRTRKAASTGARKRTTGKASPGRTRRERPQPAATVPAPPPYAPPQIGTEPGPGTIGMPESDGNEGGSNSHGAGGRSRHPSGLTPKDIEGFRELLLQKRRELVGDVTTLTDEALHKGESQGVGNLSNMPQHMAELGSDNYEQEFSLMLADSERTLLREIDEALRRIDAGTYGICAATGQPIGKARLRAKPWAKYSYEYVLAQETGRFRGQP